MSINISVEQLAQIGMRQVAYLRPVEVDGDPYFAIHAADGTPLAVMDGLDEALQAIVAHEMVPVALH